MVAASLSIAVLLVSLAAESAVARPVRPLATGISDAQVFRQGAPGAAFAHARAAGASYVRLSFSWREIAPAGVLPPLFWDPSDPFEPSYRWSSLDQAVSRARRHRLEPVVQFTNAPTWAQRCQQGDSACDPDPAYFGDFALAAARRYSGLHAGIPRVRYWMPLNEPNLSYYFNPQYRNGEPVSPRLYRALVSAFAASVKSVFSDNLVVMGGLAPLYRFAGVTVGPLDFMRRLLCMEGRERPHPAPGCDGGVAIDVWSTNPFTTGSPTRQGPHPDDVSLGDLPEMTRLLRAAERAGRIVSRLRPIPFWVLEFSYDSDPPDPQGLAPRLHARWSAEALYRAWRAGVSAFFWYGIRDEATGGRPHNATAEGALYTRGARVAADRPKRALYAFRFPLVAFSRANGFYVWGRTPEARPGSVLIQARTARGWRDVGRLRADRFGIFSKLLRSRYGGRQRGLVRARVSGGRSIPFSLKPVADFYFPPFG